MLFSKKLPKLKILPCCKVSVQYIAKKPKTARERTASPRALWLERAREASKRKRSEVNNFFLLTARPRYEQDFTYKLHIWAFAGSTQSLAMDTKSRLVPYIESTDGR